MHSRTTVVQGKTQKRIVSMVTILFDNYNRLIATWWDARLSSGITVRTFILPYVVKEQPSPNGVSSFSPG
jgi:hypothetical protein